MGGCSGNESLQTVDDDNSLNANDYAAPKALYNSTSGGMLATMSGMSGEMLATMSGMFGEMLATMPEEMLMSGEMSAIMSGMSGEMLMSGEVKTSTSM
ncbi:MAG: hypothetical protein GDA56_10595 [Hormoscilla sp. GM7CHS1pb]|nr:hypothetical protein [Hormoscilla sp. GM7CHS1pb]